MQFSISLLQDEKPEFILTCCAGENWTSTHMTGEVIVYCYTLPFSVFTETNSIDSFFIVYLINKELLQELRLFSHCCHSSQEPTISQWSFFYVPCFNLFFEYFRFRYLRIIDHSSRSWSSSSHKISSSFPFNASIERTPYFYQFCWVEWSVDWGKNWV